MINIGMIILIFFILILLILGIILYHHWKVSLYKEKLEQKKAHWEPVLFEYLDGSSPVKKTAEELGNDYEKLKDFITPYLKDLEGKDFQLLQNLAQETGITDFYLKKLKKGSNTEKIKAANFLGKVEEKRALKLSLANLENNDSDVMLASAWAIAEIGGEQYFSRVLKIILNQTNMTYEGITELFIQFGEGICTRIENLLSDWIKGRKDLEKSYNTNKEIIISLFIDLLGHFNYVQGVYLFEDILRKESNSEIIIHIFKALVKIGQPIDIDLEPYLNHENWVVRSQAVRYAGIIEKRKYSSKYKELLQKDNNWWVKYYAGETILKIGEGQILENIAETQTEGSQMSNYILNKE